MEWKKLELSSRSEIDYFLKGRYEISDLNFTNLYIWSFSESIEYSVKEESLFLRGTYKNKIYYFPPISFDVEGLKRGFEVLGELEGDILFIPEEMAKQVDNLGLIETRDSFDYIYSQKELSTLSGRKFSAKKNRINKFSKTYQWSYERITSSNIEEIRKFQQEWVKKRENEYIIVDEMRGIEKLLDNYEELELRGGLVRVDDKVVAYSIGEKISQNMAVIHVEKADINYQGAYQMINMLTVKNEFSDVEYINREDDFGDEGLRKAKLSYNPKKLLKKYKLIGE